MLDAAEASGESIALRRHVCERLERDIAVDFAQLQATRHGRALHRVRQIVVLGVMPHAPLSAHELRHMRAVLRDEQIFCEALDRFVVGELRACIRVEVALT